jgi:hypothetical protein
MKFKTPVKYIVADMFYMNKTPWCYSMINLPKSIKENQIAIVLKYYS